MEMHQLLTSEHQLPNDKSTHSSYRAARLARLRRDVQECLDLALSLLPAITIVGDDSLARYCIRKNELSPADVVIRQVILEGSPLTVIAAPRRIWFKQFRRCRLEKAVEDLQRLDRKCILVPQFAFTENAPLIFALQLLERASEASPSADAKWRDPKEPEATGAGTTKHPAPVQSGGYRRHHAA
jgi:hypothetical protein